MLPVAILAGGLATRLRPLTETIPKSMVVVGGKPFIAHQLKELARQGVHKFVLCTGYLGNMIEDFVGSGSEFEMEVIYSRETKSTIWHWRCFIKGSLFLEKNYLCYTEIHGLISIIRQWGKSFFQRVNQA